MTLHERPEYKLWPDGLCRGSPKHRAAATTVGPTEADCTGSPRESGNSGNSATLRPRPSARFLAQSTCALTVWYGHRATPIDEQVQPRLLEVPRPDWSALLMGRRIRATFSAGKETQSVASEVPSVGREKGRISDSEASII